MSFSELTPISNRLSFGPILRVVSTPLQMREQPRFD